MTLTEPALGAFLAVFVRAAAVAVTAPVIGDAGVSIRARLVFCVAVAAAISANRPGVPFAELPAAIGLELASGVITGMTASFIMARVAVAGQLMGLGLGLGFAAQYDVNAGESAGLLRTLASTLAGLAFVAMDGLGALVRGIAVPASALGVVGLGTQLLAAGASAFGYGLALAAPLLLAALVGNLGVALMNRAAPAVNVFSIALGGVLMLGAVTLLATAGNFVVGVSAVAGEAARALAR